MNILKKVNEWGYIRGLHNSNSIKQLIKLDEECNELKEGLYTNDNDLVKDSIGDIAVVLSMLAMQEGTTLEECIELAYEEIKDRKGLMIDGVFVKYDNLDIDQKEALDKAGLIVMEWN
jgi:NTP pyrophosphatase (non-canonical NTP hydrolase)